MIEVASTGRPIASNLSESSNSGSACNIGGSEYVRTGPSAHSVTKVAVSGQLLVAAHGQSPTAADTRARCCSPRPGPASSDRYRLHDVGGGRRSRWAALASVGLESLASDHNTGELLALPCDISDAHAVEDAIKATGQTFGRLSGVVASAGIEINQSLHDMSHETWDQMVAVNLRGTYLTCKYAISAMLESGVAGSIVCVSSPAAFVGFSGGGNAAYAATKGAISAFVRAVAIDYAAYGIRVNALVPGATDTPMLRAGLPVISRDALARHAATEIPLGRLAEPVEIARAAAWLLSSDASYVTGSQLVCDGGLLAKSANTI